MGGRLCGDSLMYVAEVAVKGRNTFTHTKKKKKKKKSPALGINGNSFGADGMEQIIVV